MAVLVGLAMLAMVDVGGAGSPVIEEIVAAEPEVVEVAPPLTPRQYLYATYPRLAPRLDCMIRGESTWRPNARSGPYVGLAQFDYPTWMETPQGRAGLARTDPIASIDAMAWGTQQLGYGRWPVTSRRC